MDHGLGDRRTPVLALHDVPDSVHAVLVNGMDIDGDAAPRRLQRHIRIRGQPDVAEEPTDTGLKRLPFHGIRIVDHDNNPRSAAVYATKMLPIPPLAAPTAPSATPSCAQRSATPMYLPA
ncbi:MAG: hypothetical protein WAN65_15510 [Candidatus Sulfotelmatobacter sp.]